MTETATLFVQRGRTVCNGVDHPPGDIVTLPADEAEQLRQLGFLGSEPPRTLATTEHEVGG